MVEEPDDPDSVNWQRSKRPCPGPSLRPLTPAAISITFSSHGPTSTALLSCRGSCGSPEHQDRIAQSLSGVINDDSLVSVVGCSISHISPLSSSQMVLRLRCSNLLAPFSLSQRHKATMISIVPVVPEYRSREALLEIPVCDVFRDP